MPNFYPLDPRFSRFRTSAPLNVALDAAVRVLVGRAHIPADPSAYKYALSSQAGRQAIRQAAHNFGVPLHDLFSLLRVTVARHAGTQPFPKPIKEELFDPDATPTPARKPRQRSLNKRLHAAAVQYLKADPAITVGPSRRFPVRWHHQTLYKVVCLPAHKRDRCPDCYTTDGTPSDLDAHMRSVHHFALRYHVPEEQLAALITVMGARQ